MLFILFRLIFGMVLLVICCLFVRRIPLVHKRGGYLTALATSVVITTVLALIPIENAFVTFSSPKSAYQYNHSGDIQLIVEGERTDFVVAATGDSNSYAIVPRTDDGWKLGMGTDTKRVVQTITDGIVVYLYQYKNTGEWYVTVSDINGETAEIKDAQGSVFQCLDTHNSALEKWFYTYYTYIGDCTDSYTLFVNKKEIVVECAS